VIDACGVDHRGVLMIVASSGGGGQA